jgi:hypothetical protein
MLSSVTKYVQIERPSADAYAFLADPSTMPKWAVHNVKSIKPLEDGRWELDTPRGKGSLVPHYQKFNGILDHDFIDASEGFWSVAARVVPIGASASVYMITLTKPDGMPTDAFDGGMKLMDDELAALKACIEAL